MHIAVCGELGAGCTEVGQILSRRLGMKCVNSSDVLRSAVVNFRGVHPGESFREFERHVQSGDADLDNIIDGEIDGMLELEDIIVEGRSAFMLLNNEDVFKVLLVAPKEERVKRVAKERDVTVEEAEEDIRVSDDERKHMVKKLFKKDWLDPYNYDMAINTGLRNSEETAALIVEAIQRKQLRQLGTRPHSSLSSISGWDVADSLASPIPYPE